VASAVDEFAPTYWERVATTRWGRYVTERQREALLYAFDAGRRGTCLDVGCDGGRWSSLAAAHGWQLVCTDVNADSLALCRRRLPTARCLHVSPADKTLPVETNSVELVIVYEVPQLLESHWCVPEVARALSAEGRLVCSYWNPLSLRGGAYRLLRKLRPSSRVLDYYGGPPYHSFRKTLQAQGFELVREEGICWFPFTRDSDSRLVPLAVKTEAALGLRHLTGVSPWVLVVAIRRGETEQPAP
jgi:SAM-dependent methyltransferase